MKDPTNIEINDSTARSFVPWENSMSLEEWGKKRRALFKGELQPQTSGAVPSISSIEPNTTVGAIPTPQLKTPKTPSSGTGGTTKKP